MTQELSKYKLRLISEAQNIADEKLKGSKRFTDLTLWDDGDFKVEVLHGLAENGKREKIVYRSSESNLYEAESFTYVLENVTEPERYNVLEVEKIKR